MKNFYKILLAGSLMLIYQVTIASDIYNQVGLEYKQENLVFTSEAEKRDIVGWWLDINNKGRVSARIEIYKKNGKIYGKSAEIVDLVNKLRICTKCTDDRKNQNSLGMEIIRDLNKVDGKWDWKGGQILDPSNGNIYRMRAWTSDDGTKLHMRGYLGPFYQTRIWLRTQKKLGDNYSVITEADKIAYKKLKQK